MPEEIKCRFILFLILLPLFLHGQASGRYPNCTNPYKYDIYTKISSAHINGEENFNGGSQNYSEPYKKVWIGRLYSIASPVVYTGLSLMADAMLHNYRFFSNYPVKITAGVLLLITPSAGHIYAGNVRRPILYSSMRLCALGVGYGLGIIAMETIPGGGGFADLAKFIAGFGLGVIGMVAITVVDISKIPLSVNEYNDRITIQPKINFGPNRCRVGISCRF